MKRIKRIAKLLLARKPSVAAAVKRIDGEIYRFLDSYIAAGIVQLDNEVIGSKRTRLEDGTHYLKIDRLRYWVDVQERKIRRISKIADFSKRQ